MRQRLRERDVVRLGSVDPVVAMAGDQTPLGRQSAEDVTGAPKAAPLGRGVRTGQVDPPAAHREQQIASDVDAVAVEGHVTRCMAGGMRDLEGDPARGPGHRLIGRVGPHVGEVRAPEDDAAEQAGTDRFDMAPDLDLRVRSPQRPDPGGVVAVRVGQQQMGGREAFLGQGGQPGRAIEGVDQRHSGRVTVDEGRVHVGVRTRLGHPDLDPGGVVQDLLPQRRDGHGGGRHHPGIKGSTAHWHPRRGANGFKRDPGAVESGAERMLQVGPWRAGGLVAVLLLMLAAPLVAAEPAENGLELLVEVEAPAEAGIHTDDAVLEATLRITNHADVARTFTYNPACPYDLVISQADWSVDLDDTRICPEQSRAMTVQPGQTRILSTFDWDWQGAPDGDLVLRFSQPEAELETVERLTFHRAVDLPADVVLEALLAETVSDAPGHTTALPGMVLLQLRNTGDSARDLSFSNACRVVDTDLGCGVGTLEAGHTLALGWTVWEFSGLADGAVHREYTMTGVRDAVASVSTELTTHGLADAAHLIPAVTVDDAMGWHFALTNTDDVPAKLLFGDACTVNMHVISPGGEIVFDGREGRDCPQTGTEQKLAPAETFTLASGTWDLRDADGCEIQNGLHLMVFQQPDTGRVATHAFEHVNSGVDPGCRAATQDAAQMRFTVAGLSVLDADDAEERLSLHMRMQNLGEDAFEMYWPTDCALEFTLARRGEAPIRTWTQDCDGRSGETMHVAPGAAHAWPTFEVPFHDGEAPLANGTWLLTARTTSVPSLFAQAAHTYDGPHVAPSTVEEEPTVEETPEPIEEEFPVEIQPIVIRGDWHYVTEASRGCWLLVEANGAEHSLVAHLQDGRWQPTPGRSGTYLAEPADNSGDCAKWSGLVLLETLEETVPAPPMVAPAEPAAPVRTPVEGVLAQTPTAAAVVASTSISILALMYIGNTEWIRIPALQIGVGLVGMVRRGREHDGEYQRGRIMGYLTANPGVHFRALLGALEMSNGQLTHHLKHLEGEERIWRRKDGRLVRFYPASITATQNEEDLPVPLLTPDPNSLQGKILRLLDATENDILNLSQKELSVRLEASQQLISHHLRTLEKFGLVEREKVGMRYRYQLTREAIFLVNSTTYNVESD